MKFRAVPAKDVLIRGDNALVLVGTQLTMITTIAVCVLSIIDDWTEDVVVAKRLVEQFGVPDGNVLEHTRSICLELAAAGLVEDDQNHS